MKVFKRVAAVIIVLSLVFAMNMFVIAKEYNSQALYGSFVYKRERAESLDSEKFIVAGGSASNLGFDSAAFEELSGKPAVNLSLSAGIPLRVYMKAAEDVAQSGDVIILPLEYEYYAKDFDAVTESYVDVISVDYRLKNDRGILNNIECLYSTFLRSFTRLNDCIMFFLRDKSGAGNTIYIAESVNEYGDFCLHKDKEATYESASRLISFAYDGNTMEEICGYIERMQEKGVKVYVTYPVIDKESISDPEKYFSDAEETLKEYIPEEKIIGTPYDFAYEPDCFFDTLYHLKYENRREYTEKLYSCYKEAAE